MFSKPIAFSKQIAIYLNQHEYAKAQKLSEEFTAKFPHLIESYYFLALSSIPLKDYSKGLLGAQKAFVLSQGDDVVTMGVLLAQLLYLTGNTHRAKSILISLEATHKKNKDIEELLSLIALAENDQTALENHFKKLVSIDRVAAKGVVEKLHNAKKR